MKNHAWKHTLPLNFMNENTGSCRNFIFWRSYKSPIVFARSPVDRQNHVNHVFRLVGLVKAAEKADYSMFGLGQFGKLGIYTVDDTSRHLNVKKNYRQR